MKDLLHLLISKITNKPDEVSIEKEELNNETIYKISAPQDDLPFIIGKGGSTIKSLTDILICSAQKNNSHLNSKIILQIKED